MSKGNPIVPIRLDPVLVAQIDDVIARTADTRRDGPYTRSSFIVKAILDKLAHIHRSNRKNRKERACTSTSSAPPA